MNAFRYQAIALDGNAVRGVIEAENRKAALQLLSSKGLFPPRSDGRRRGG